MLLLSQMHLFIFLLNQSLIFNSLKSNVFITLGICFQECETQAKYAAALYAS